MCIWPTYNISHTSGALGAVSASVSHAMAIVVSRHDTEQQFSGIRIYQTMSTTYMSASANILCLVVDGVVIILSDSLGEH